MVRGASGERLGSWLREHPRACVALLFAFILALLLRSAWVAEDAFISFRSVEQLLAGNGPRWNPNERVQAFTHPLWFGVLALARAATGDAYWAAVLLDLVCAGAAVLLLFRARSWRPLRALWITALLVSSKAWIDYASSGLENALSYLLLAGFLAAGLRLAERPARRTSGATLAALSLGLLLALNRLDSLALTLPPLLWVFWQARRSLGAARAIAALALASLPLAAWTAFSVVYFGFPLPNTAYAKLHTGIPAADLARQGGFYLWNSLRWDPVLLVTIAWALALAWRGRDPLWRCVAIGLVLDLLYVLCVGGDFMSGRFLSVAYLAAALLFVECAGPWSRRAMALALLCLPFLSPSHPLRASEFVKRQDEHRIADERSFYARETSLATCLAHARAGHSCPDHEWMREGRELRRSGRRLAVRKAIGMYGYAAGIGPIIIDSLALTDPLLARLPVVGEWRIGHFWRRVPEGYLPTLVSGENQIRDPGLREWYEHMRTITQGPLFSRERWVTIVKMNLGVYRPLLAGYAQPPP